MHCFSAAFGRRRMRGASACRTECWKSSGCAVCSGYQRLLRHDIAARCNHPMDLFGGTREDIYAFTHAVMYTADFNIRPTPLPRSREVLLGEAEAVLARALDSEDYDIGGELLLTWPLTGTTWSAAAAFGFRVLADVEDQVGFLPAAATRLDRLNALQGEARGEYLTATAYPAALAPDREPPQRLPFEDVVPGSAAAILPFLDDGSRRRHWQDTFDRLSVTDRDAVSRLLLTIALHRRVATHDFAGVAKLLELAMSLGMTDSPAASQAAELLDRLILAHMGRRATPARALAAA